MATDAIASSLAKMVEDPTADISRTCSNGRSGEDKYSYSILTIVDRFCT